MPAGILLAFNIINGLLPIVMKAWSMIKTATAEGRDLTDAELDELRADRKAAVNEWLAGVGPQT